jgi:hypothetical protein
MLTSHGKFVYLLLIVPHKHSSFQSRIAMPVEILPQFLQDASKWLLMTHFVELAQGV